MDPVDEEQDIVVHISTSFPGIKFSSSRLSSLVEAICSRFQLSQATVSIAVVDDPGITELNKCFLDRDRPTDCLSFDLSDNDPGASTPGNVPPATKNRKSKIESRKLFELVINGERAVREAQRRDHGAQAELALYITHGLLHQLGFDDSTPQQAARMHHTEDEILQEQGFGLVYNTDTG